MKGILFLQRGIIHPIGPAYLSKWQSSSCISQAMSSWVRDVKGDWEFKAFQCHYFMLWPWHTPWILSLSHSCCRTSQSVPVCMERDILCHHGNFFLFTRVCVYVHFIVYFLNLLMTTCKNIFTIIFILRLSILRFSTKTTFPQ